METYYEVVFSPSPPSHECLSVLLQELSLNMRWGVVLNVEGGRERERERERESEIEIK